MTIANLISTETTFFRGWRDSQKFVAISFLLILLSIVALDGIKTTIPSEFQRANIFEGLALVALIILIFDHAVPANKLVHFLGFGVDQRTAIFGLFLGGFLAYLIQSGFLSILSVPK